MVVEEEDDGGVNPCIMIGAVVARMHTNVDRGLIFFYVYGIYLIYCNFDRLLLEATQRRLGFMMRASSST